MEVNTIEYLYICKSKVKKRQIWYYTRYRELRQAGMIFSFSGTEMKIMSVLRQNPSNAASLSAKTMKLVDIFNQFYCF